MQKMNFPNGQLKSFDHTNEEKNSEFFEQFEEASLFNSLITYLYFFILQCMGKFRDFLRNYGLEKNRIAVDSTKNKGFAPLYVDFEAFYTRNVYRRVCDCVNKPICSAPGGSVKAMNRVSDDHNWSFRILDSTRDIYNFGSYNYLGFAQNKGICADQVEESIDKYGLSVGSPRQEVGNTQYHLQLEDALAAFLGQEASIVFPMGFATNALNIPILVDKECCVISDEHNHVSLILGIRLSGAQTRRFKHNNIRSLEKELIKAVTEGNLTTKRKFKKILIVVEGIYSMEGSILRLPEILELKKKYKFYLYIDEAHSIGALGKRGRGIVDYFNLNPNDVDIQMGTFTKCFASSGGYISGKRRLINYIREKSHSSIYGGTMSAPICQQILSSMAVIAGKVGGNLGQQRLLQLAWNTTYFRAALHRMGLIVFGNKDSPVIPVIVYTIPKVVAFHRECMRRGIGTVIVGYPACDLKLARIRFCISAAHTKQSLDYTLSVVEEIANHLRFKYSKLPVPQWCKDIPQRSLDFNKNNHEKDEFSNGKLSASSFCY